MTLSLPKDIKDISAHSFSFNVRKRDDSDSDSEDEKEAYKEYIEQIRNLFLSELKLKLKSNKLVEMLRNHIIIWGCQQVEQDKMILSINKYLKTEEKDNSISINKYLFLKTLNNERIRHIRGYMQQKLSNCFISAGVVLLNHLIKEDILIKSDEFLGSPNQTFNFDLLQKKPKTHIGRFKNKARKLVKLKKQLFLRMAISSSNFYPILSRKIVCS